MVKAKKSYGQHFLHDENICRTIAESILSISDVDIIVEVGPGKGAITKYLVTGSLPLFVIEADRDMVSHLHRHLPELPKENIISADFLKVNLHEIFAGKQIALVGNFPYNISSQIVIKAINDIDIIKHLVGMFQKEMADRIMSGPGTKDYSSLSVQTAALFATRSVVDVGPEAFSPPPKVQSKVIALDRLEQPIQVHDWKLFRQVVRSAFGQRRKMLRNSLKAMVDDEEMLQENTFTKRPEQLSLEDFVEISNRLYKK
jgi:16S rRNA (adenine1518-N6/adenine1519-N6)-dimethyltransferase